MTYNIHTHQGVKEKILQKLLGHAEITRTLNRYVHSDDNAKKSQFKK